MPQALFASGNRRVFCRPASQPVLPFIAGREVGDGHGDGAAGVTRIFLFDLLRHDRWGVFHWNTVRFLHSRIEWELDVVPHGHVAGRLVIYSQMAALEIAEMPDVVDGHVPPANFEWLLASVWQRRAFGEKWIEGNATAAIALAPHSEITREFLAQNITSLLVGLDCQTDCSGRTRMQGTANPLAESVTKHAAHDRQFTASPSHIER